MNDNENELLDHPLQRLHDELEERFGAPASIGEAETPDQWFERMQTMGLLSVWDRSELRNVRNVAAMKLAEAEGAIVDIRDDAEPTPVMPRENAEAVLRDPAARAARADAQQYWKPVAGN